MNEIDVLRAYAALGMRPSASGRNLIEEEATDTSDVQADTDDDTDPMELRTALKSVVARIAAGELAGDEAVTALIAAFDDPGAVQLGVQESEWRSKERDQRDREKSARDILESIADGDVAITPSMVRIAGARRTVSERWAKAREVVEAERARLKRIKAGRRAKPLDAAESIAVLMNSL